MGDAYRDTVFRSPFAAANAAEDTALAGVEGVFSLSGAINVGRDSFARYNSASTAQEDEHDLVAAAQEEALQKYKHARKKKLALKALPELEQLDQRIAAIGQGTDETYMQVLSKKLREHHVVLPTVTIQYSHLNVGTKALVGSAGIPTVGNKFLDLVKMLLFIKPTTVELQILKDIEGVLLPGRCTLLLGPPSSGKSSFLKLLAGRLKPTKNLHINGSVLYNGHSFDEFRPERTAAFVAQQDNHIPSLTVMETLEFAFICQQGYHHDRFYLPEVLREAITRNAQVPTPSSGQTTDGGTPNGHTSATPAGPLAEGIQDNRLNAGGVDGYQPPVYSAVGAPAHANAAAAAAAAAGGTNGAGGMAGVGGSTGSLGGKNHGSTGSLSANQSTYVNPADEEEFLKLLEQTFGTGVKTLSIMRLFGISHTKDTPVGDASLRGISGGERKRVTTAEMLVGPRKVLMMDEISTGLDSATLHNIIKLINNATTAMQLTTVVSLLQPPPEVFFLFKDVMLMAAGRVVYHGPVADVLPFFQSMGFICPPRKDVPSFLQEVTTAMGQHEYASPELKASKGVADGQVVNNPLAKREFLVSVDDMVTAFWETTPAGRKMRENLARPYDKARSHPAALVKSAYALKPWEAIRTVTVRQLLMTSKDPVLVKGRLIQVVVIGLIVSSLFYQLDKNYSTSRTFFGVSFLAVMFMAMGAMPQLAIVMQTKGVWLKFRDARFYPAYAHAIGGTLALVPFAALECAVFSLILYFMVHFHYGAGYFFTFYLVLVCISVNCAALFRMIAHLAPDAVSANAYGGFMLLILIVLSGYAIVRKSIPDYWIWGYYISPFAWALRSVVINEMSAPPWQGPSPNTPGITLGEDALMSFDFYTERYWIWAGVGYLIGCTFIWMGISTLALTYLNGEQRVARVADEKLVAKARQAAADRMTRMTSAAPPTADSTTLHTAQASGAFKGKGSKALHTPNASLLANPNGSLPQGPLPTTLEGDGEVEDVKGGLNGAVSGAVTNGVNGAAADRHAASHLPVNTGGWQPQSQPATTGVSPFSVSSDGAATGAQVMELGKGPSGDIPRGRRTSLGGRSTSGAQDVLISIGSASRCVTGSQILELDRGYSGNGGIARNSRMSNGVPVPPAYDVSIATGIPFQPVTLVFQDLRYFVPNPSYKKQRKAKVSSKGDVEAGSAGGMEEVPVRLELLKGITGSAEPGMLMALMGGSGAGKTTLMDVIAGRKTVGQITGSIYVNGHIKEQKSWSRVMGYVEQMDIHTPAQTVIEALHFSARLRLDAAVSDEQVKAYVDDVLGIVDLTEQMFDLVGTPGVTGLSTEQRKRLTIAVELVANPSCVFMDEPTSGLDARAAALVMRAVRNVARNGRTVMVTIHQPSIEIFEAFDQLLLLQRGGRVTYFGPLGYQSNDLVTYLQRVPGVQPLSDGYNPATWMLEVTGGAMSVKAKAVEVDWPQLYRDSPLAAANARRAQELVDTQRLSMEPLHVQGEHAASFKIQVEELLKKFRLAYWRTPSYNFTRFITTILVASVYGSVYFNEGNVTSPATLAKVQNVMGVIYSSISFIGMSNMMAVMPFLGYERVVYYREQAASMYSPWAYGLVTSSVEAPYLVAQMAIFNGMVYGMIFRAQKTAGQFFIFFLFQLESLTFYTSFGQALVYITPSQQLGQVVGAGLNFLFNIFNGFIITYPNIPIYYKWANRGAPTTWLLYGLVSDQLGGKSDVEFVYPGDATIDTIPKFLDVVFGYTYSFRYYCLLIVAAYIIFFRVIAVLALRYMSFLKR